VNGRKGLEIWRKGQGVRKVVWRDGTGSGREKREGERSKDRKARKGWTSLLIHGP